MPPPPTPNPQGVPPTNLQHSYTEGTPAPYPQGLTPTNLQLLHINGPPTPTPYPQPTGTMTNKLNTHTLMEPPTLNPQGVPPDI